MNDRRGEDRLYTAIVMAFLAFVIALGLLGVPALSVTGIGAAVAALGIAVFRRALEGPSTATRQRGDRRRVPSKYVPSVLEGSSMRRRRIVHPRRRRHASAPLRFR